MHIRKHFEKDLRDKINNEFSLIKHILLEFENCNNIKEVDLILIRLNDGITILSDNITLFANKILEVK